MIRVDEAEAARRLGGLDLVALMRMVLRGAADGLGGGPVRAAFTTPRGLWFAAMPAWTDSPRAALGAKLVIAAPGNAERGLPTHRAVVVLLDPVSGEPAAWVEAEGLTRARTAAVSVVATETLARVPHGVHAILGAGAQGRAHVEAFARAGLMERLAVWSRDRARAGELADAARGFGIDARVADDPNDAVRGATVVTTCTASAHPLFDDAAVADGTHLNAIGACVADRRELPGRLVGEAALVVDDEAAARTEAGDVILAVAEGAASWDGVAELGAIFAGRAVPRGGRVSVFVSLGLGVEDVAAAAAVAGL
ncbi:MAG: Ornithine cyclodeaminase [Candidatus Eremiobacteraeota bacterium]|nr:Ornithine cyclodeaminase [Candidatus Eremiobacteraeota bacterium]